MNLSKLRNKQTFLEPLRQLKQRMGLAWGVYGVLFLLIAIIFILMINVVHSNHERRVVAHPAKEYIFSSVKDSRGFEMHVLKADPSNITLEVVNKNVTLSDYYGINGGFFFGNHLVSMAMVNGEPVGGNMGQYGVGFENMKYPRGTLVWDGGTNQLTVQIASLASELQVFNPSHYWAQGGISMSIGHDDSWYAQVMMENAPLPDDKRLRTAMVYDQEGMVYLIVSTTKGSLAEFRSAILEKVGKGQLVDGIFLDGDGSSQLQAKEKWLPGDNRPVVEMVRLIR